MAGDRGQAPRGRGPVEELTVAEVMTRDLLTIGPAESVLMAWELMHQGRCHHLPVVDDEGHCLGVLDAQTVAATWEAGGPERARRPVTALLAAQPSGTVRPDEHVSEAARVMLRCGTDHAMVTDSGDRLAGLVTARDLIAALAGVVRPATPDHGGMPSLYRLEAVLPARQEGGGDRRSELSPE